MAIEDFNQKDIDMLLDMINNIKDSNENGRGGIIALNLPINDKSNNIVSIFGDDNSIIASLYGLFMVMNREGFNVTEILEILTNLFKDGKNGEHGEIEKFEKIL